MEIDVVTLDEPVLEGQAEAVDRTEAVDETVDVVDTVTETDSVELVDDEATIDPVVITVADTVALPSPDDD